MVAFAGKVPFCYWRADVLRLYVEHGFKPHPGRSCRQAVAGCFVICCCHASVAAGLPLQLAHASVCVWWCGEHNLCVVCVCSCVSVCAQLAAGWILQRAGDVHAES